MVIVSERREVQEGGGRESRGRGSGICWRDGSVGSRERGIDVPGNDEGYWCDRLSSI